MEALQGTGVDPKRFIATAKTAIQSHPDVDRLAAADRQTLYLAIKRAASDGLMVDGREAALVCYRNTDKNKTDVQYQPMVQGLVKLARNSGEIEGIGAYIVHEKDRFSYRAGIDPVPTHECDEWFGDRGAAIGVWAFVKLKSGEYAPPVMLTKKRIDSIATRSKMAKNYDQNIGKDWEEWWKKAAIRNVLKYAPRSTAIEKAMEASDGEFDMRNEGVFLNEEPAKATQPTETRAAAAVKAAKPQPQPEVAPQEAEYAPEPSQPIDAEFEELPV